jgi:UDP-N-acetylglucosamine 2-epimerase (non-hydrolysing)/GDP/UDP-N,N'-diacetylbacillosamine 2-epimerase (hydrolysing)
MLMAAFAGAHMNIPVVHVHGGEVTGSVDEFNRHAISKLSHAHLVATGGSRMRLIRMGEEPSRIHIVGAPALDIIRTMRIDAKALRRKYRVPGPFLLVAQHPVTTEPEQAAIQMQETMEAIKHIGMRTILILPNTDAGGKSMISAIKAYKLPFLTIHPNIPPDDYLGLLSMASALVGNTSSGIIEAPSFHVPFVCIGSRQQGREHGANVIFTPPARNAIAHAVRFAIHDPTFLARAKAGKNPYGDGHAAERAAKAILSIRKTAHLLQKRLTY